MAVLSSPGATSEPSSRAADSSSAQSAQTGRGIGHAGLSFAATLTLGLVSAVIISRIFGVAVIGEFALASAAVAVLPQLSTLGEQTAMVRSISHEPTSSVRAVSLFLVVLGFSATLTVAAAALVTGVTVLLLRGPVDQPGLVRPAAVLVLGYVLVGNVSWNVDRLLSVFRGTRSLLLARLWDVGGLLAASVVAGLLLGPTVWSLVWANLATLVPALLIRLWFLYRLVDGRPTRSALRSAAAELPELVRFGLRTLPGVAASAVSSQAGTWLVGSVATVGTLGAYSRANNLSSRITDAGYRLSEVLLPVLSSAAHEHRYQAAADDFLRWRLLVSVVLIGGAASLAGPAQGLLAVFGPGFGNAWLVMGLLLFAYSGGVVNVVHADLLLALGHPVAVSTLTLVRSLLTLALIVPLTLTFGIDGTGMAVLFAYVVELICLVVLVDRRLARLRVQTRAFPWLGLLVSAVAAVTTGRVVDELGGQLIVAVLGAALAVLVYSAALLLTRTVDAQLVRSALLLRRRAR